MKIEDLFPPCQRDNCPDEGAHKHILPGQKELLESPEKYVAYLGGYGAGKTLPACALGNILSMAVPGNLGIVLRRSLPKLHDSTERIYLEVLQRSGITVQPREMRDGWPHRLLYPNGSEVVFRETTDIGRFLGPEYGWFYIDEAQEEPEATFLKLTERLRLPRAAKYLKGIITSNPPHHTHWLAQRFPEPGTWVFGGSTYRMIRSSTVENPFLDPSYVEDLKANHPPSEVQRIIEGFYGFTHEGKAVYAPPFLWEKHVADIKPLPMTLTRSWDFGFRVPAVTWHQMFRCKKGGYHWNILHEYVGQNIEAENLAHEVQQITRDRFPDHKPDMIVDCGDAAGAQVTDKGPGPIIRLARDPWKIRFRYKKLPNIDPGLALVRKTLHTKCECGFQILRVARHCKSSIDMFAGGYHYPQEKPGKGPVDKPVKDGYYDNVADSIRYFAECIYRPASRDPDFMSQLARDIIVKDDLPSREPWAWMGA